MASNPIWHSNVIKHQINNKRSCEKTYNPNNETKMWGKFLRVSPEDFYSMSDSEIESKIVELEKKHRLEVAENLIAYVKEKRQNIRGSKENPQFLEPYDERSRAGANIWDILCQAAEDMDEMYGDGDEYEYSTSFEETLETTNDDPSTAWETIDQDTLYMGDRTGFGETFNQTSVDDRTYDVSGIIDETYNISGAEADSYERSWNQQNRAMTSTPKYREPMQSCRSTSRSGEYHPRGAIQLSPIPMPTSYAGPSTTFTRNTPPPNLESPRGVSISQRRPLNRTFEVSTPQLPSQNFNSTRTYQTRPSPRSFAPKLTSTRLSRGTPSSRCYDTSTRLTQGTPASYYDISSSLSRGTPSSRFYDTRTRTRLSQATPPSGFSEKDVGVNQKNPYCDVRNQSVQRNYSMPGTPVRPRGERGDPRRNLFSGR